MPDLCQRATERALGCPWSLLVQLWNEYEYLHRIFASHVVLMQRSIEKTLSHHLAGSKVAAGFVGLNLCVPECFTHSIH